MAGATNGFELSLLRLIFVNASIADIGDSTGISGASAAGTLAISLHSTSADLEAASSEQGTNEVGYTNYARITVARTTGTGAWTIGATNTVSNITALSFAQCGATGATASQFGIGSTASNNGTLFLAASLTASLNISNGVIPQFAAGALTVTLD